RCAWTRSGVPATATCACTPPSCSAISTLSLHDALPISNHWRKTGRRGRVISCRHTPCAVTEGRHTECAYYRMFHFDAGLRITSIDRKSTRLNSSHVATSYAVFCLNKKQDRDFSTLSHKR